MNIETENLNNWLEMLDLLSKKVPLNPNSHYVWIKPLVYNSSPIVGYKIHIPFHKEEDASLFADLISELYILGVHFKLVKNPNYIDSYGGTQLGKHLVLYPKDLTFLSRLSNQSKNVLFDDHGLFVPNEEKIGGTRMFTRFCNYSDDSFYNLDTEKFEFAERGASLPDFAKLPSTEILFDAEKTNSINGKKEFDILKIAFDSFDGNFTNSIFDSFLKTVFYESFKKVWSHIEDKTLPIALIDYDVLIKLKKYYDSEK